MWVKLREALDQAAAFAKRIPVIDLVGILTATVLLRNSHGGIYAVLSLIVLLVSVISRRCRHSHVFWLLVALAWAPRLILDWYHNEDHVYLGVYWTAALGLALWGKHQEEILAQSARVLIGLAFGIAFLWKIFVPAFVDGSLLHYKLLYDFRFRSMVTQPVAHLTDQQNAWNHTAESQLLSDRHSPPQATLEFPNRVTHLAVFLTLWTIAIEGLLAVLFLMPPSQWTDRWRDPTLIVFLLSTYIVAPVMGFASLFTTMGLAQVPAARGHLRVAYGATLASLTVWFSVAF